jgi:hypothetical protein
MDRTVLARQHRRMSHPARTLSLATLACVLAAQASGGTKLLSSWHDPAAGPLNLQKVLVLCIAPHESQRQFGEAELVRLMKRTRGVASYTVMKPSDVESKETAFAFMAREGFDGAVVMRFIGTGHQVTEVSAYIPTYTGFWDYYSFAGAMMLDPGYVRMERMAQMETQVFTTKNDKVVWSGLSQTKNPDSARELIKDVAQAVASDLRKHRLIR